MRNKMPQHIPLMSRNACNGEKLPWGCRFKVSAKSGLWESGDFGEKSPEGWRYPIFKLDAKWPLEIR